MAGCTAHARNGYISTSGLKSDGHHRVPRPRFLNNRENFGDSLTVKADMGLLNICMGLQDSWPKMGALGTKQGKGWCDIDPKRTRSYFLGFLRLCQFW